MHRSGTPAYRLLQRLAGARLRRSWAAAVTASAAGEPVERSSGKDVDVRRMAEGEVGEVSLLLRRCYAWLGEREGMSSQQTEFLQSERGGEQTIRLESAKQTYLVASDGSGITGLVAVSGQEITKLYVLPSWHGAGVGRTLFEAAETAIRSGGHPRVVLGAFPTALPFYKAMGLRAVGERECGGALAGLRVTLMEKQIESGRPEGASRRPARRRR
jgi:GNAT superfamily N-acetyltransferase